MKQYLAGKIRNVALAGHSSSGKTTLAEALLYKTGYSDRLGKVADGNTVCDFDPGGDQAQGIGIFHRGTVCMGQYQDQSHRHPRTL